VILGKVSAKEEISTVVVAARACGNVKNLSLLAGYTGGRQTLIVILGKVSAKEEISTVVVAARACGNVKNLSLLAGYTGGRQASCGHE